MPGVTFKLKKLHLGDAGATLLGVRGFVDATTTRSFRLVLDKLLHDGTRHLILDFSQARYINSSGILALLNAREAFRRLGGELILVRLPRQIGYTMHLLGLTKVVPVLYTERDALEFLKTGALKGLDYAHYLKTKRGVETSAAARYVIPLLKPPSRRTPASSILMIVPQESHFTDLMKTRLFDPAGRFFIVFSCLDALKSFQVMSPDLIVLEDSMRYSEEFLAKVKIERGHSLTSVIKLYANERDLDRHRDFKIWENDYLVEPFEMMELFTLAEAELRRVPSSRQHLLQQVRFEFKGRPANLKKGLALLQNLVHQSGLDPREAAAMNDAVREALDNAVQHGNRRRPGASVQVIFLVDTARVYVTVEDEGDGFDFAAKLKTLGRLDPAKLTARRQRRGGGGGLGLLMMQRLTDRLEFAAGGRIARLEKNLPQPIMPERNNK